METVKLEATVRENLGKKYSKEVRRASQVPCNLYGGKENVSFSVDYNKLRKGIYTDTFNVFEIVTDKGTFRAIPKEIQFHPVTDMMIHVDFQELVSGKKVKTQIPLVTKGFAEGQKTGGKLELKLRKVSIKADADKIPSQIEIDVTPLELGKSLRIKDLITDGYEILNHEALPIVSVVVPRALRSASAEEAAEEAAAEGDATEGEGGEEAATEGGSEE